MTSFWYFGFWVRIRVFGYVRAHMYARRKRYLFYISGSDDSVSSSVSSYFFSLVRYALKVSSHASSSVASLNHSLNLPSLLNSSKTVFNVVRKCFFVDDCGCPCFLGPCIHAPMSFFGMELSGARAIFPMYVHVHLVMKKSMSGMFSNLLLTSLFDILCSLIWSHLIFRMYLIAEW